MTGRVCSFESFEGCGRPHRARGWCAAHWAQWRAGKPLTPIGSQPRRLTPEIAQFDVEEFEFLLSSGETLERAVARMGVCAKTILRRYQLLDREVPQGLWWFERNPARRAAV